MGSWINGFLVFKNITNKKFGRLVARYPVAKASDGACIWYCDCRCGKFKNVRINSLLRKIRPTHSCGCLIIEHGHKLGKSIYSHKKSKSRVYRTWIDLRTRCTSKRCKHFKDYGGRGIMFCRRWKKFENFYLDMGDPPSKIHSIDRINNDKGYCKKNCKWSTPKQQAQNRRPPSKRI